MSSDDNLYRAPQSSLQTIAPDGELTPAMVEYLSKGAFWARVLSIFLFLCFIGMGFYVFSLFYTSSEHMRQLGISSEDANVMAFLIGVFLGGALTLIMLLTLSHLFLLITGRGYDVLSEAIAVLVFGLLSFLLFDYRSACKAALESDKTEDIELACRKQVNVIRFFGALALFMLLYLGFWLVVAIIETIGAR